MPVRDTDTHHVGNYSRTNAQGFRVFADCDPLVSVNDFDNDSIATSIVDLCLAPTRFPVMFSDGMHYVIDLRDRMCDLSCLTDR